MQVYKRKDGKSPYWHYDLVNADGKRVRLSTKRKNKREAEVIAQDAARACTRSGIARGSEAHHDRRGRRGLRQGPRGGQQGVGA